MSQPAAHRNDFSYRIIAVVSLCVVFVGSIKVLEYFLAR
jgi:hypothetical protein